MQISLLVRRVALPITVRSITVRHLALLALVVSAFGCTDTIVRATLAEPSLSAAPSPATAEASTIEGFEWMATFTVTIEETAGTGADVTLTTAFVSELDGGEVLGSDGAQVTTTLSSDRLDPNGVVTVEYTVAYTHESGAREALVEVRVQVIDDNVIRITRALQLKVE